MSAFNYVLGVPALAGKLSSPAMKPQMAEQRDTPKVLHESIC
jgi:hypothetical protein